MYALSRRVPAGLAFQKVTPCDSAAKSLFFWRTRRNTRRSRGVRWAALSGASSSEQKVEETTMIQLMRTEPRLAPVREMLNSLADGFAGSSMPGSLPLDIVEKADCYEVYASVPGLTRDQIAVEVEKGILTINTIISDETVETSEPTEAPMNDASGCGCSDDLNGDGCCMLRRERYMGSAKRSLASVSAGRRRSAPSRERTPAWSARITWCS